MNVHCWGCHIKDMKKQHLCVFVQMTSIIWDKCKGMTTSFANPRFFLPADYQSCDTFETLKKKMLKMQKLITIRWLWGLLKLPVFTNWRRKLQKLQNYKNLKTETNEKLRKKILKKLTNWKQWKLSDDYQSFDSVYTLPPLCPSAS